MKIQGATSFNERLAKLIFLVLPSTVVGYFLLWNANTYFSILQNQAFEQAIYLGLGMCIASILYAFRLRFISTFAVLVIFLLFTYKGLDRTAIGEFDTFFISVRFLIFSTLFTGGWIIGALFSRVRYAHYFVAGTFMVGSILLLAKQRSDSSVQLLQSFLPAVGYCFYIVFAAEQIYNYKDKSQKFWWFMIRRVVLFSLLLVMVAAAVSFQMKKKFEAAIAAANGKGAEGNENGMLKKNKYGNFDLKDYSQLRSNQGRSNELLFAAHIDNFFPGTDIPNPLYLTAFYYTKFDTSTETFERDKEIPKNDLFKPDPSRIPMYSTRTDSSVIENGMASQARQTVEIEIYNKKLSPSTYLAPNTGFFVQPIAIEKDFRGAFYSAYRAKGYVSDLNSAYFIYNAKDPQIKAFQEQRFSVLRKAKPYDDIDKAFMSYYTRMPSDEKFKRIASLAQKITANAHTPVDKVIAIRDYFLSKDEEGKALFSYTDNPGVPDIPSASKLMYFLFENHKGYCAYYAGATLFMLRALGIPSRITVGFMTIDRSDKNKGWYWYYADQAHAWVQVYFPGFGWLDFDTTVGNDEAQQSPKPDGTPPMQPPHAWFASEGQIVGIDTLKKTMKLKIARFLFHDKEYQLAASGDALLLDISIANFIRDSASVGLNEVHIGDSATAVSYAESLKKMKPGTTQENGASILKRMASPIPTDDVYLKKTPEQLQKELKQLKQKEQPISFHKLLLWSLWTIGLLLLLFLLLPIKILYYFKWRIKWAKTKELNAYWQYRALSYYLHQLGYFRGSESPLSYAQQVVDPAFDINFTRFMNIYLRIKYTGKPMQANEEKWMASFYNGSIARICNKEPFKKRLIAFLKPLRSIAFFTNK